MGELGKKLNQQLEESQQQRGGTRKKMMKVLAI